MNSWNSLLEFSDFNIAKLILKIRHNCWLYLEHLSFSIWKVVTENCHHEKKTRPASNVQLDVKIISPDSQLHHKNLISI